MIVTWMVSGGAEEFISETLGMTLGEVSHKFDVWAVARSSSK